jgi:hypothetical protein
MVKSLWKSLKKKPITSVRKKNPFKYFNYAIGQINFDKHKKKSFQKGLLKIRSNSNPSKVNNYHLVKVLQKKISHLTLSFHSLTHS